MESKPVRAIIVGAGIGGLACAEKLRGAGFDVTVYEAAGEVGGTWRDNTYPGLYVDVPSRQYEFPFRPNHDWSRRFAPGPEIQAYIRRIADECALRPLIRFDQNVLSARYAEGRWHIATAAGLRDSADLLVCATGFLRVPVFPDIPGQETFNGPSFHSARWDHAVPIEGKRWGIIGGGASGIQITEALAKRDCTVTQVIRRAQWVHIRENPPYTAEECRARRRPGAYERERRELWDAYSIADAWRLRPGPQRAQMERDYRGFLDAIRDPVLRAKLTPDYHLGCTRIPKSDQNYYLAVQQPNVRIENRRIARVVPTGLEFSDGARLDFDVLVYATGFDAHAYMRPMTVEGPGGVTVDALWKDRVFSYNGCLLPGFPNLFLPYGPFSPVNNVSVPLGIDQQLDYLLALLAIARERGAAMMPTREATDRFVQRIEAALPGTVWVGCRNWYADQSMTPVLWPLPQDDHTRLLERVVVGDFELV